VGEVIAIVELQDDESGTRHEQGKRILEFLNAKTGKNFRLNATTLRFIESRLAEGFTVSECKMVIAKKVREWKGAEFKNGMRGDDYLRPSTLFNATNFNNYVADL
jgi:uncharacterized phage protein (TIGR02220 family)